MEQHLTRRTHHWLPTVTGALTPEKTDHRHTHPPPTPKLLGDLTVRARARALGESPLAAPPLGHAQGHVFELVVCNGQDDKGLDVVAFRLAGTSLVSPKLSHSTGSARIMGDGTCHIPHAIDAINEHLRRWR